VFLDHLLNDGKVKVIFSEELLMEFVEVSQRSKLQKFFAVDDIKNILNAIENHAEFVAVTSKIAICRDENDNFLLSLAKDSQADYLITGDHDLLVIKEFGKTQIITMAELKTILFF
jgi:putative PIN family toxin of toxin-antitoxin system